MWGYLKQKVYHQLPKSIQDLKKSEIDYIDKKNLENFRVFKISGILRFSGKLDFRKKNLKKFRKKSDYFYFEGGHIEDK